MSGFRRTPLPGGAAPPRTRPPTRGDAVDRMLRQQSGGVDILAAEVAPQQAEGLVGQSLGVVCSRRHASTSSHLPRQTPMDGLAAGIGRAGSRLHDKVPPSPADRSIRPAARRRSASAERKALAPVGSSTGSRRGAAAGHGPKDRRTLGPTALGVSVLAWQVCRIAQRRGGASSERRAQAASDLAPADRPARRRRAWTPRPATWWATADRCAQLSPLRRPTTLTEQARGDSDSLAARPRPQPPDRPAERNLPPSTQTEIHRAATLGGRPRAPSQTCHAVHSHRLHPARVCSHRRGPPAHSLPGRGRQDRRIGPHGPARMGLGVLEPDKTWPLLKEA